MLPDLRVVIAAVLSTFVLTVGVGFYTSSRLIQEPKKRTDSLAALDETPVNRIALSWPAPIRQSEPLALDFAVTSRASRNPVRDVSDEPAPTEQQPQPRTQSAHTSAADLPATPSEPEVAEKPLEQPEPVAIEPTPVPAIEAEPVLSEAPKPAPEPEPDIRVTVQYPPILELPPELRAPEVVVALPEVAAAPEAAAVLPESPAAPEAAAVLPESPAAPEVVAAPQGPAAAVDAPHDTTASIANQANGGVDANDSDEAQPVNTPPEAKVVAGPERAEVEVDDLAMQPVPIPKPAPKARMRQAPKKAAPARAKRPAKAARRTTQRTVPTATATWPWSFLGNRPRN